MKRNKTKFLIVLLSVLAALVSCALIITLTRLHRFSQGTSTAPGNQINRENPTGLLSVSLDNGLLEPKLLSVSDSEKIKLTEEGTESVSPFALPNLLPGDSVSKTYRIAVKDETATALTFSADFFDNTQNETDSQKNRDRSLMNLTVTANGKEIYNGDVGAVEELDYALNDADEVTYVITVSLATTAGNEYAGMNLALSFHWSFGYLPLYRVTYCDGMGGNIFANLDFDVREGGNTPVFEGTPIRSGYRFSGWEPTVTQTVSGNAVYSATWEKLYTVTYTDGSENETYFENQVYSDNEKNSATPAFEGTPVREGYTFNGWYPAVGETVIADVVYTAQWQIVSTYTVTYTDGVENEELFVDKVFTDLLPGAQTPAFGDDPVREGYTFNGWYPEVEDVVSGSVTYTAKWHSSTPATQTYSVTYTDGTGTESVFEDKIFYNLKIGDNIPAYGSEPTRDGYVFAGWSPSAAGKVEGNVTFTARWLVKTKTYTVIYTDGVDDEMIFAKVRFDDISYGALTPEGPDKPTRKGYTFKGWFPEVSEYVTADVTYVAQWEAQKYETHIIDEKNREADTEIFISNPKGGDEWVYHYQFQINEKGLLKLYFKINTEGVDSGFCSALNVTVACDENEELLYHGSLTDMPESLKIEMEGEYGESYHFTVTLLLDPACGDAYQNSASNLKLEWWAEEEPCRCPLCALVRICGGPDCICPYCAIGYAILGIAIAVAVVFVILQNRKPAICNMPANFNMPANLSTPTNLNTQNVDTIGMATESAGDSAEETKKKKKKIGLKSKSGKSYSARAKRRHRRKGR